MREENDTLWELQEYCQKSQNKMKFAEFPQKMLEEIWGLPYLSPVPKQSDSSLKALADRKIEGLSGKQLMWMNDQIILSVAFGQIKITGTLDQALIELAFHSLDRMEQLCHVKTHEDRPLNYLKQMRCDLSRFVKTLV